MPSPPEFVTELPEPPAATRASRYDPARAAMTARPGEWLRLPADSPLDKVQARNRAAQIRAGAGRWAPAGRWDAEARPISPSGARWAVFARSPLPDAELADSAAPSSTTD